MVLVTRICQSVMCVLMPAVFYSKPSGISSTRQRSPLLLNTNSHGGVGAVKFPTPVDILLRQLAAINPNINTSQDGAAAPSDNNISTMLQEMLRPGRPSIKIYGEGTEYRFPPFLEFLLARIQSFFSVYRYEDTSRPGAGSFIHDVEMINPTKVTLRETLPTENSDSVGLPFSQNGPINRNDYEDDVFEDGTGVVSI